MALLTGFINGLKVIDSDSNISVGKDLQEGVDKSSQEEMTNG